MRRGGCSKNNLVFLQAKGLEVVRAPDDFSWFLNHFRPLRNSGLMEIPAIKKFWPDGNPKDLRPFKKN
jgi:hypothetical protein